MATRSNPQSRARRQAGRELAAILREYDIDLRAVSKHTGIDLITLENLSSFTPHLATIEKVAAYLEPIIRERRAAKTTKAAGLR